SIDVDRASLLYNHGKENTMRVTRRQCLETFVAASALRGLAYSAEVSSKSERTKLSMPGLYRGPGGAVENQASMISDKYQAEPIREMMHRGMAELTGQPWQDAWKQFFQPGDVVGIKVNPSGRGCGVISSPEVVNEIIAGLNIAGVKNQDI